MTLNSGEQKVPDGSRSAFLVQLKVTQPEPAQKISEAWVCRLSGVNGSLTFYWDNGVSNRLAGTLVFHVVRAFHLWHNRSKSHDSDFLSSASFVMLKTHWRLPLFNLVHRGSSQPVERLSSPLEMESYVQPCQSKAARACLAEVTL